MNKFNIVRFARFVIGTFFIMSGYFSDETFLFILGLFLTVQAILNLGCESSACNNINN